MSAPGRFTVEEEIPTVAKSARLLGRFINSLPLLKRYFPWSLVLTIAAVSAPQLLVWLSGEYLRCSVERDCAEGVLGGFPINLATLWIIFLVSAGLRILSWIVFEVSGQWSAQQIHSQMVNALMRVRATYFDENPSGRLINRLARDFDAIRSTAVIRLGDTMQTTIEVLAVAAIVLFADPVVSLMVLPLLVIFFSIQLSVSVMLQRLTVMRSIRLGEFLHRETDLVDGARIFVLYDALPALLTRLRVAVSNFVQVHLVRTQVEAWGRCWTSSFTSLYTFIAISAVTVSVHRGEISIAAGAVVMTVIFRMSPVCLWLTWSTSSLVESLGTVRRAFQIADLPDERTSDGVTRELENDQELPEVGPIQFVDYAMSYRDDSPLILKDLNLTIPVGAKIGIVGRTGSGKSSLVQSLFRMVYVRAGDIRMSGRSILHSPIDQVRGLFAVVPQDPYLFVGTVRSNLDRGKLFSDLELESVLDRVGLGVSLDREIREGGKNLSFGERQLICLARVLLTNRPFVIMDEPTSGVDTITDAKMQRVISESLRDRTIITIAHRVDTLRRCDTVVQLASGGVLRKGTPAEVLPHLSEEEL